MPHVLVSLACQPSIGFGYPIPVIGGFTDPNPFLDQLYPDRKRD
jgi:hypothetical protein